LSYQHQVGLDAFAIPGNHKSKSVRYSLLDFGAARQAARQPVVAAG